MIPAGFPPVVPSLSLGELFGRPLAPLALVGALAALAVLIGLLAGEYAISVRRRSHSVESARPAMTRVGVMRVLLPALLFVIFPTPKDAAAEDETFLVKSMAESRVQIQFFSQDRHHVWPSAGRAYDLNDYSEHAFKLGCISGEKICYGAWVTGNPRQYWGVGDDGKAACQGCCYTCEGKNTKHVVLRSPIWARRD
jgi:hypothetical protein